MINLMYKIVMVSFLYVYVISASIPAPVFNMPDIFDMPPYLR